MSIPSVLITIEPMPLSARVASRLATVVSGGTVTTPLPLVCSTSEIHITPR